MELSLCNKKFDLRLFLAHNNYLLNYLWNLSILPFWIYANSLIVHYKILPVLILSQKWKTHHHPFNGTFKNSFVKNYILVGEWIKHQIASCWSSLLAILTRFSPRIQERKGASESSKILVDGAELTLDCMGSLCAILLHFGMDKEMCWLYERLVLVLTYFWISSPVSPGIRSKIHSYNRRHSMVVEL